MRTPEDGFYTRFTVECSRVQIGERGESGEEERGEGVECIRVKICGWGRMGEDISEGVECSRVKICGWGWEREAS